MNSGHVLHFPEPVPSRYQWGVYRCLQVPDREETRSARASHSASRKARPVHLVL